MPNKIGVVRIFSRLNIGGPSIHVILLTAGLNPERFQSLLVVGRETGREGNMLDLAAMHGVKPRVIPSLGRKISFWNDLAATLALWRLIRKQRPQVVHTHTSKAGFSGRLAARLAGVPVIVHTFHGHVFHGYFGPVLSGLFVWLERIMARWSDVIIAISDRLKDQLVEKRIAPPEKILVIELGLDLQPFLAVQGRSHTLRQELNLDDDHYLIGIIGRLVPVKDHRTFIKAASIVAGMDEKARFVIVGDGELREELQQQVDDLGMKGTVYFTGWKKDLAPIYADLDLVVLSSKNEGTPVSIIEGSAACRPVVATQVGGIPDMIRDGHNGLLVAPGNPEEMAHAIIRLRRDAPLARSFACRARDQVARIYPIKRLVSDLESLYLRLLTRKGIIMQAEVGSADKSSIG